MSATLKGMGVKTVGGGVTYAGSYEVSQKVLEVSTSLDPQLVTQWATAFAAVMTGLYFMVNALHIMRKERRETKDHKEKNKK